MIEISHLIQVVDAYRSATGFTDSSISNYVFNDGKKIKQLRTGGDLTMRRFNFALNWFSKNWPEDAVWPDGIARPGSQPPIEGDLGCEESKEGIE